MSKPRVGPPELVSQLKLCTSNHYGQPIVRTELASNIISKFYSNVDGVYDLTVVHPGVKHKLHTHVSKGTVG